MIPQESQTDLGQITEPGKTYRVQYNSRVAEAALEVLDRTMSDMQKVSQFYEFDHTAASVFLQTLTGLMIKQIIKFHVYNGKKGPDGKIGEINRKDIMGILDATHKTIELQRESFLRGEFE